MPTILSGILSLAQYIKDLKEASSNYRPECCSECGKASIWCHGFYPRKARSQEKEINPILIPRFFCPECHKTCSVLPECIAPRRWYLWSIQQAVLISLLARKSINAISQRVQPSRSTCRRWFNHFKNKFLLFRDALCAYSSELGRTSDFNHFWQFCFKQMSLDRAMLICHLAGVPIP